MLADNYFYGQAIKVLMALDLAYENFKGLEGTIKAYKEGNREYIKERLERALDGVDSLKKCLNVDDEMYNALAKVWELKNRE